MIRRLWKPWFVYQPSQLLRRAAAALAPSRRGYQKLRTSWGVKITADPTKTIGMSIQRTGVFDLAVTEAMLKLIDRGDTIMDVGANIGYMTVLAAVSAGLHGTVIGIEPHPALFDCARANVELAKETHLLGKTELHNLAMAAEAGSGHLEIPFEFEQNDGVSRIVPQATAGIKTIRVSLSTIDDILGKRSAALLKLDVEGYELTVLAGAQAALREQRIKTIIYEDHHGPKSGISTLLEAYGYHVFSLGWSMTGLAIQSSSSGPMAKAYEAPNYIATLTPEATITRCNQRGWLAFRQRQQHPKDHSRSNALEFK